MAQKLIVEGNDAIALATLCKLRGLKSPIGYGVERKFRKEFIGGGQGYHAALEALEQALNKTDYTNIGIIVDANDAGAEARWQAIRKILAEKFSEETLSNADKQDGPKVIQEDYMPVVGVWIMPDNKGSGYLEHFLAGLVPPDNALWAHAKTVLDDLQKQPFNEITPPKAGKARLHTWLAWKKDPGKPFGQALASKYFNINTPEVDAFLDWFGRTFRLGE